LPSKKFFSGTNPYQLVVKMYERFLAGNDGRGVW